MCDVPTDASLAQLTTISPVTLSGTTVTYSELQTTERNTAQTREGAYQAQLVHQNAENIRGEYSAN